jgi:hypothetical protein
MSEEDLLTEVLRKNGGRAFCATHGLDCMFYTFDFDGDGAPHGGSKRTPGII